MVKTKKTKKSKAAKLAKKNKKIRRQKRKQGCDDVKSQQVARINPKFPFASYVGRHGDPKYYTVSFESWNKARSSWQEPVSDVISRLYDDLEGEFMRSHNDGQSYVHPAYYEHSDFVLNRTVLDLLFSGNLDALTEMVPVKYDSEIVCRECYDPDFFNSLHCMLCDYSCKPMYYNIDYVLFQLESSGYVVPENTREFYIEHYADFNPSPC